MPSVPKTDLRLYRLLGHELKSKNDSIQYIEPNIKELTPFYNEDFILTTNSFLSEDKPLNYFGCFDSFSFTINMNYENIEKPFTANFVIAFIFTDPVNKYSIEKSIFGENKITEKEKKLKLLKEYSKNDFNNQIYIVTSFQKIQHYSDGITCANYQYEGMKEL